MNWRRSMRNILAVMALVTLLSGPALATDQIPDRFIYQGNECKMWPWPSPLGLYFNLHPDIPRPEYGDEVGVSTACWRGHVATWKVIDGRLHLVRLAVPDYSGHNPWQDQQEIEYPEVLRDKVRDGAIFADWFSGVILVYVADST